MPILKECLGFINENSSLSTVKKLFVKKLKRIFEVRPGRITFTDAEQARLLLPPPFCRDGFKRGIKQGIDGAKRRHFSSRTT